MSDEHEKKEPHRVDAENAEKFWDWIKTRGGLAIWRSVDLSDPGASCTCPLNDKEGHRNMKPHWKYDDHPERIITDPSEVLVETYKEVRRFRIAVRPGSQGMSLKLTDHSSEKVREACRKAGKDSTYVFDYGSQEAVILVPDKAMTLVEWAEKNVRTQHLGQEFLTRTIYAVHTDFDYLGSDIPESYGCEEDAFKAAATIAYNNRDQRNFGTEDREEFERLWTAGNYKGVVAYWGERMSEESDHLDFIHVIKTTLYLRA